MQDTAKMIMYPKVAPEEALISQIIKDIFDASSDEGETIKQNIKDAIYDDIKDGDTTLLDELIEILLELMFQKNIDDETITDHSPELKIDMDEDHLVVRMIYLKEHQRRDEEVLSIMLEILFEAVIRNGLRPICEPSFEPNFEVNLEPRQVH